MNNSILSVAREVDSVLSTPGKHTAKHFPREARKISQREMHLLERLPFSWDFLLFFQQLVIFVHMSHSFPLCPTYLS